MSVSKKIILFFDFCNRDEYNEVNESIECTRTHRDNDMATMTIRNIEESLKSKLRMTAAQHGCSMEEEVRRILRKSLLPQLKKTGLGTTIHQHFKRIDGVDLQIPARSLPRQAVNPFEQESDAP